MDNLELIELNEDEQKDVNGGFWVVIGAALVISAIDNFGDIRQGIVDGWYGKPRYAF